MSDLPSGARLGGFVILRKLGAGGMGIVYLARDDTLDRELAVKLLGTADESLLEEARLAARLEHPAIVPVYAAGVDDGRAYLAMRYVAGGTLQQRLATEPPDRATALRLLTAIADALDTAHRAGLVHHDVKPANILVDGDRALLADFGLARRGAALAHSLQSGLMPGTIGYVAPEQIEGDAADGRADQYALACVAFECLTGRQPFARATDVATIYAHLSDPVPRASALRPLPTAVDAVLARALGKRAADRFDDCGAFIAALGAALDQPVTASAEAPSAEVADAAREPSDDRPPTRRKLVTVLAAELSWPPGLGEQLDVEALRELSLRCHGEMRAAVTAHGGTVERFAGETVVGLFGIPTAHEDDALRATRAAFDVRRRVAVLDEEYGARFAARLGVRIGIATGEVAAGPAGGDEPLATGGTLDLARRLGHAAAGDEILLGELTRRLTRDAVTVERVPELRVSGVSRPVQVVRALALVDAAAVPPRRLLADLVGRRPQLAALRELFRTCREARRAQLVALVGEPGAGKTRLAHEFVGTAAEATVLRGRCVSYGEGITYLPLAEAIRRAAGGTAQDPPERLRERIGSLVPAEPDAAEFLAVAAGVSAAPASPEEIAWAARTLVSTLAEAAPVIFLLDEVQWAEPTLLELVGSLGTVEAPVLVLCLARTEIAEVPAWRDLEGSCTQIAVERLTDSEASELVGRLLTPDADRALVARLTAAAGGNPLFLEELCQMLADTSEEGDGRPSPIEARSVELPATLDALITSRLDVLPDTERLAIETAAVEGPVFTREAVTALAPAAQRDRIGAAIDGLVRRDLARPTTADGASALRFRHLLVRDVAYRGIAKARRADTHEQFARWLERASSTGAGEHVELVGYHLEQAWLYRAELGGDAARLRPLGSAAAMWLERAAERARTRGDGAAAVTLLQRAAAVVPGNDLERGRVLVGLGATLTEYGRLGDARDALQQAGVLAAPLGDAALQARLAVEELVLDLQVDPAAAVAGAAVVTASAASVFARVGDSAGLGRVAYLEALVNWIQGRVGAAEASWVRAAELARQLGDAARLSDALRWVPSAALYGPMPVAAAIPRCEEVLSELHGSRRGEAAVLGALSVLYAMCGDFDRARSLVARRDAIIAEVGFAMHSLGEWAAQVELLAGDARAAETHLRERFERLEEIGERAFRSTTAGLLARALHAQGRDDEALAFTGICEDTAAPEDLAAQIAWRGARARILAAHAREEEAVDLAREAVALAERTDLLSDHGDALLDLTEALRALGRTDDAGHAARQADALYRTKGNVVAARRAQSVLHDLVTV